MTIEKYKNIINSNTFDTIITICEIKMLSKINEIVFVEISTSKFIYKNSLYVHSIIKDIKDRKRDSEEKALTIEILKILNDNGLSFADIINKLMTNIETLVNNKNIMLYLFNNIFKQYIYKQYRIK